LPVSFGQFSRRGQARVPRADNAHVRIDPLRHLAAT